MSHDVSTANPYRKVSIRAWSDAKVNRLSPLPPSGQSLFLMLLVGPQTTNIPGVQPVGRMAFAEMLGWELEDFNKAFAEAYREGLAVADWKARLIYVPKAIRHNLPQSPNVVKSWAFTWSLVPDCELKITIWKSLREELSRLGPAFVKAFDHACQINADHFGNNAELKPTGKPTDNQEQEQDQDNTLPLTREDDFKIPLTPEHDLIRFVDDDDLLTDQAAESGNPMSDNSGLHHVANSHTQAAHSCTGEHLQFDSQFLLMARTTGLESHYTDENLQDIFNLFRCYKTNAHTLKSHADWLGLWRTWCQREKTRYAKSRQQPQSPASGQHSQPGGHSESNTQRALRIAQQSAEKLAGSEGS